jgi:hypothetical protein
MKYVKGLEKRCKNERFTVSIYFIKKTNKPRRIKRSSNVRVILAI